MENEIKETTMATEENITNKEVVKPLVDVEQEKAAKKAAEEEKPGFFKKVGNGIKANRGKIIGGTVAVISAIGGYALGRKAGIKSMLSSIAQETPDYIPEETEEVEDQIPEEEI